MQIRSLANNANRPQNLPAKSAVSVETKSEQVVQDSWDPTQSYASLISKDGEGHYHLDGVRWDYQQTAPNSEVWAADFTQAKIDTNKVKDVSVGVVPFMNDKIGHAILVFDFEEGSGPKNERGESEDKLVLSVDARMKPGEKWSIKKGLKREYPLVYQLDTFSARAKRSLAHLGDRLVMHRLDLDEVEKKELLENTLEAAVTPKENYHSTRNSCWTNVIDLLNMSVDDGQKIRKKSLLTGTLLQKFPVVNPVLAGSLLEASGLRADEPGLVIQADRTFHPDKQVNEKISPLLHKVSKSSLWTPACSLAAGAATAALGHWMGGVVPAVVGGLFGASVGKVVGDEVKVRNNVTFAPAEQFYGPNGLVQENAEEKVS